MANKKPIRTRGKISLSRYFRRYNDGDRVSIVEERSVPKNFPGRLQGRTGIVEGKQGRSYRVKLKDQNKEKVYLVQSAHLKKIKN